MKIAALFPGQGSQEVGMGTDFLNGDDKKWFENVDDQLSFSLLELLENGPAEKLERTRYTQPALFTVSHLIYRYLSRNFSDFNFYAGHSLGEYNALAAGGWADFEELLPVVVARGKAMDEQAQQVEGSMAAVLKMDREPLEEFCAEISADESIEGTVEVALFNSPGQSVVSGSEAANEAAVERARDAGALKAVSLDVSGPWHSRYMEPVREELAAVLGDVDWQEGRTYLPNTSGVLREGGSPEQFLIDQLVQPVDWVGTLQTLFEGGCSHFVEIGPGNVLSGLVKRTARKYDVEPEIYQTDNLEQTQKTVEAIKNAADR